VRPREGVRVGSGPTEWRKSIFRGEGTSSYAIVAAVHKVAEKEVARVRAVATNLHA